MKTNNMKYLAAIVAFIVLGFTHVSAQNAEQRKQITQNYDLEKLKEMEERFSKAYNDNYARALELAAQRGWETEIIGDDGRQTILTGVTEDNQPIYITSFNEGAATTARTSSLYPNGALGLNLTGANMTIGMWEIGSTVPTHELFEGRITQVDAASPSSHANHVAGTMIGGDGIEAGARGMAYEANLRAFTAANDVAETASEAATGNLLSNHSYGFHPIFLPVAAFGHYDASARNVDEVMHDAPFYLGVYAAGNTRQFSFVNGGDNGYDVLSGHALSKNGMSVAAVEEVPSYTGPASVLMSGFSSWGPTDDGRIKPDISAKGVDTYSANTISNSSYNLNSGTSMAAPSVAGTLLLLQEHYNNVNSEFMLSSTLRGLACHTADEAGSSDGPDYQYGWGLINAERAAETITNNGQTSIVTEQVLSNGESYTIQVQASSIEDLAASITWTDPEGIPGPVTEDLFTVSLVNDLDIIVTDAAGNTSFPWILDVANPSAAATTGDNFVDNIEKVDIDNPNGMYSITVSHKGTLAAPQAFSLIVTGISNSPATVDIDCNYYNYSSSSGWQSSQDCSYLACVNDGVVLQVIPSVGDISDYNYSWTGGGSFYQYPTHPWSIYIYSAGASYTVNITDLSGNLVGTQTFTFNDDCNNPSVAFDCIYTTYPATGEVVSSGCTYYACPDEGVGLQVDPSVGTVFDYQYSWNGPGQIYQYPSNPWAIYVYNAGGTYTVDITDLSGNPVGSQTFTFSSADCGSACLDFDVEDFESSPLDFWTLTNNSAHILNNALKASTGQGCVRLNTWRRLESPAHDFSLYSSIEFNFEYAAAWFNSSNQGFIIEKSDNGTTWWTVQGFYYSTDFTNSNFNSPTYTSIPTVVAQGPFSSTTEFRIRLLVPSNQNRQLYIDNLSIVGCGGSMSLVDLDGKDSIDDESSRILDLSNLEVRYDTHELVWFKLNGLDAQSEINIDYNIYNTNGGLLSQGHTSDALWSLDISDMPKGMYIIQTSIGSERFVVR